MNLLITNLGLLQRISRFNQAHKPERRIRRFRPGSANRQIYGEAALLDREQVTTYGTLGAICRQAGILAEGEVTLNEAVMNLMADLKRARAPQHDMRTLHAWMMKRPRFADRWSLLTAFFDVDDIGISSETAIVSTGKEIQS